MQEADTTVCGIEAIKLYMPPTKTQLDTNAVEEKGRPVRESSQGTSAAATMTSVERYRQEWTQLIKDLDENQERIRDRAFNNELKVSKFRSLYWALLLRVLNSDYLSWLPQREQQRKRYKKLKQEFMKNPHELNVPDDNPLSQASQSIWNQYFSDQDLFAVIRQDVVRTFPGVDFFRKDIIQNAMTNILFYYAREHPYMSYRQGMHEILAPILFVVYSDHQSLLHFKEISGFREMDYGDVLLDVLNPNYLEEDSYSIFSRLMSSIESYYRISNFVPEHELSAASTKVEVIGQLNFIRDKILAKEDLHLHNYLSKLDIPLHLFGIRWLRLLFGREFLLLDLLVLWDAIFADSDRFALPNYILVAMLIRIRDKLLLSDYTTCLTFLMRYPANMDISLILRHALHMQMPKKFERPTNAFVYFTPTSNPNDEAKAPAAQPRTNALYVGARHSLQKNQQPPRTPPTPPSEIVNVEQQIMKLQARNAAEDAALARLKVQAETTRVAMDGYLDNSPELLRLELKNAQTIITMARSKLQAYMATVRKHVVKQQSPAEFYRALDGIDELSSLLDVRSMFPLHSRTKPPIDEALEANEQNRQLRTRSHLNQNTSPAASAVTVSRTASAPTGRLEVASNKTYLRSTKLDDDTVPEEGTYERPDQSYRFNSTRFLGSLKEIELIPIVSDEKVVMPAQQMQNASIDENGRSDLPLADPMRSHVP